MILKGHEIQIGSLVVERRAKESGVVLLPFIFIMVAMGVMALVLAIGAHNARTLSVGYVDRFRLYNTAKAGVEFAIKYASEEEHGLSGLAWQPVERSFDGGAFTVSYDPWSDVLTSIARMGNMKKVVRVGGNERRGFTDFVAPSYDDDFDVGPEVFDERYFLIYEASDLFPPENAVVLNSVDDEEEPAEEFFTLYGEVNGNDTSPASSLSLGRASSGPDDCPFASYIVVFPTAPDTGELDLCRDSTPDVYEDCLTRKGLSVPVDGEGYQNYTVEVRFYLNRGCGQDQGISIFVRLHNPEQPLSGPLNSVDLGALAGYELRFAPALPAGESVCGHGGSISLWWWGAAGCNGEPPVSVPYCVVGEGGYFCPEHEEYIHDCDPAVEGRRDPGWGWWSSSWFTNEDTGGPALFSLRVTIIRDRIAAYLGSEAGGFRMAKILDVSILELRNEGSSCVPLFKAGHIGIRTWASTKAVIDRVRIWRR